MQAAQTDLQQRSQAPEEVRAMSTRQCLVITAAAGGAAAVGLAELYYYLRSRRKAME